MTHKHTSLNLNIMNTTGVDEFKMINELLRKEDDKGC